MAVDISGKRFGRLVAVSRRSETTSAGRKRSRWLCRCDCGNEIEVILGNLTTGSVKSCGCLAKEASGSRLRTHGMPHTREYATWASMISRCHNPNAQAADNYGNRGIVVCDRWRNSFENFYADMGPRPSDCHSIERRDVNGNYEPGNCHWATGDVQSMNRRNTAYVDFRGERITVMELSRRSGVPYAKLMDRIQRYGHTAEEAIGPDKEVPKYTAFGKTLTLKEWAVELGINYYTLYDRFKLHGSIEAAVAKPVRRR